MNSKNFVAIDFETANGNRASACSIGAVRVEGGFVVDSFSSLIAPHPDFNFVAPFNMGIHGISERDLIGAPCLPDIWDELIEFTGNLPIVAHNLDFDADVLRKASDSWELPRISNPAFCSLKLARSAYPDLLSFKLDFLAEMWGIKGLQHHDALSDAETCAELVRYIVDKNPKFDDFSNWPVSSPRKRTPYSPRNLETDFWTTANKYFEHAENRVAGYGFTFTGKVHLVHSRTDFKDILDGLGAKWIEKANKNTDFLVVGDQDSRQFAPGETHSKNFRVAQKMADAGHSLEIITENDFREMLPDDLITELLQLL